MIIIMKYENSNNECNEMMKWNNNNEIMIMIIIMCVMVMKW